MTNKIIVCILLIVVFFVFFSIDTKAYSFSLLLGEKVKYIIGGDFYVGYYVFYNIVNYGGSIFGELNFLMKDLYIGAGIGFDSVWWDLAKYYDQFLGSISCFSTLIYGKYLIFDDKTLKNAVGIPMFFGVIGGFRVRYFLFKSYFSDYHGFYPIDRLSSNITLTLAPILSFKFKLLKKKTILSFSLGIIDNLFDYAMDLYIFSGKKQMWRFYWVLFLGGGVSYIIYL